MQKHIMFWADSFYYLSVGREVPNDSQRYSTIAESVCKDYEIEFTIPVKSMLGKDDITMNDVKEFQQILKKDCKIACSIHMTKYLPDYFVNTGNLVEDLKSACEKFKEVYSRCLAITPGGTAFSTYCISEDDNTLIGSYPNNTVRFLGLSAYLKTRGDIVGELLSKHPYKLKRAEEDAVITLFNMGIITYKQLPVVYFGKQPWTTVDGLPPKAVYDLCSALPDALIEEADGNAFWAAYQYAQEHAADYEQALSWLSWFCTVEHRAPAGVYTEDAVLEYIRNEIGVTISSFDSLREMAAFAEKSNFSNLTTPLPNSHNNRYSPESEIEIYEGTVPDLIREYLDDLGLDHNITLAQLNDYLDADVDAEKPTPKYEERIVEKTITITEPAPELTIPELLAKLEDSGMPTNLSIEDMKTGKVVHEVTEDESKLACKTFLQKLNLSENTLKVLTEAVDGKPVSEDDLVKKVYATEESTDPFYNAAELLLKNVRKAILLSPTIETRTKFKNILRAYTRSYMGVAKEQSDIKEFILRIASETTDVDAKKLLEDAAAKL